VEYYYEQSKLIFAHDRNGHCFRKLVATPAREPVECIAKMAYTLP